MKTYILNGKNGNANIALTIMDLIPLEPSRRYDYTMLINLINYKDYEPNWDEPMEEDYTTLYSFSSNKTVDFFKIRHTSLIVLPGMFIYPTILTEKEAFKIINEKI
jgi:hypothetical protein